ncbi:glycosyltransferase family 4 protein [Sphingomonas baiyangensis]|uniref:Glycosyltransferase family 4 protein n=1 Tax=Sphingomonas baiyangensis TaxID=2572576 RepID=A0A4U1L4G4_9SPHN|nr:glycosyltransferase family 4 protein [Sphingomonas baiyangensis]TKD51394.1 glycosyltransferase family 4 protein [Sphingomonas baiyangensis]
MARVLLVASYAPSLVNFRAPLIGALRDAGHDVHVAAPDAKAVIAASSLASIVTAHETALDRAGGNPLADLASIAGYHALMRRVAPSHVLPYTIKPVIYATLAARLAGVPHRFPMLTGLGYLFESDSPRALWMRRVIAPVMRAALRGADAVIFQNPDDRETIRRAGLLAQDARAKVVDGSGIDLDHFTPQPQPSSPAVLFVGRLVAAKGVAEFAAAARIVRARRPDVAFRIAGWIDAANPSAIAQADLDRWVADGDIEYLGRLDDVRPALAAASIFCLPSLYEGTPRTGLEALATGRAIVTTDAPGCREIVREGSNGHLVPVRSAQAIADAALSIVDTPGRAAAMGEASLAYARERYDVRRVNAEMLRIMRLEAIR